MPSCGHKSFQLLSAILSSSFVIRNCLAFGVNHCWKKTPLSPSVLRPFSSPSFNSVPMSESFVAISDAFDGGNIEYVGSDSDTGVVLLKVKPDPFTELEKVRHMQYFSFRSRMQEDERKTLNYVIENAGECSYPSAWPGSTVFYSKDRKTWRRVLNTTYDKDSGHLKWSFDQGKSESVHFCYFPPYSYDRHLDLISKCEASEAATVKSLGKTLDGREMEVVVCGTGPRSAWIIHRQHPGENMAEFFAEGLLNRLLGLETDGSIDGLAKQALDLYTFHIVPNMNPDGAFRGHLRTNACGANLNREWCSTGDYEVSFDILYEKYRFYLKLKLCSTKGSYFRTLARSLPCA